MQNPRQYPAITWRLACCLVVGLHGLAVGAAADESADDDVFARHVAPVFEARCLSCHSTQIARGQLALDTAAGLSRGGESGALLVAGKPGESLLVEMLRGDEPAMPQEGEPLSADELAGIERWIAAGARWPEGVKLVDRSERLLWWSLAPLKRPETPQVDHGAGNAPPADWPRNDVDRFVLAQLLERGLKPSPEADRRTLIRRLTFDLHGLPPAPEEIETFVNDPAADAYERLVDRLLASPRYGERWARHWLDVAHYGETHGYDKDKRRDNAWPYRDYVIDSFNADKPFGRFIREQLAGDVLWPDDPQAVVATGFIAAGPWDFVGHVELREETVEKAKTRTLDRDDMVASAMSTFVGLTVHCARCHEHKFDPIPQVDYYRLQAVFAGLDRGNRPYGAAVTPADGGDPVQPHVYAVLPRKPRSIHLLERGDVEQPRESVTAGALSAVAALPGVFELANPDDEGGRRAALAEWIADTQNPLTWRTIVNRAWHYRFGRGLVETPNDLGRNGALPTHPELLDWLAVEFRDGGQSFKALDRLLVASAAYRQQSRHDEAAAEIDGGNQYLWRMNRRRLDAESFRDAVLAVSGKLDLTMGGPSFELFAFKDDHSPRYDPVPIDEPRVWRRTIYRYVTRSVPNPFLETLDCPDPSFSAPVRGTTITALQALATLNNFLILRHAEHFAARLKGEADNLPIQVDRAYALALGRQPDDQEREDATSFVAQHGLPNFCRLLFNANEFLFVE